MEAAHLATDVLPSVETEFTFSLPKNNSKTIPKKAENHTQLCCRKEIPLKLELNGVILAADYNFSLL